ncbi:MAG TPA: carboxypeptidase regulatory-like domain-containing protein [Candidatus Ozemobacteraceae bacterium]|nr:carboxypeptidase regulatory-like domain-containing protein [Candidatus Ozemobacteraceae bacterium]
MMKRVLGVIVLLVLTLAVTGCLKTDSKVTGNIMGKVFDSNGHVLRGASVEIYGGDHTVKTDELGRYYINGVEPGQKKVVATYEKKSVVKIFEIPRGGTLEGADLTFEVVDGLPPVITDVRVDALGENGATILWNTNELSNSLVDYALGPIGLGSYTWLASDSAMVEAHSVTLAGLTPNTTYHFRVRSFDYAGNEGISSDYQFHTPSGEAPSMPASFAVSLPTEMERLTLTWAANSETDLLGYNLYRAESKAGPFVRVNADPIQASATSYIDEGLKIAWKYYYYLKAVDTARNESAPTAVVAMLTPGMLIENRTWKESESPFVLYGDVRVRGGAVLTVEPGVEVRCAMTDSLPDTNGASMTDIIVQGGLYAVGTSDKRIVFTSAETFPRLSSWGGIRFLSTIEPENQLKYVTVMFADTGVRSEGSSPVIENTELGLCGSGLDIGLSAALNIRYNTIRDCTVGLISASSNVRNNLFVDNQIAAALLGNDVFEHNTIDGFSGIEVTSGLPTIRNNIISYIGTTKGLYGIKQTSALATPTISFNDIFNFTLETDGLTVATGSGNIASDPVFVGGVPYNYQLQSTSPCLTAGDGGVQMGRYGP